VTDRREWTDAASRKGSTVTHPKCRLHWQLRDAFAMAGILVKVYSVAFCQRGRASCGEDHIIIAIVY